MDARIEPELDSDDEMDWEEVEVPERHFEITISTAQPSSSKGASASAKRGITYAERVLRIDCHKVHTIALLGNACVRNKWINDPLLHARLISVTPLALQNAFAMIHKSRIPDQNQRGRMFENAIKNLVDWWSGEYFEVFDEGHIRNRTFDDVQKRLVKGGYLPEFQPEEKEDGKKEPLPDSKFEELDEETLQELLDDDGERIRSPKSMMKHALNASGSRDTSAQLFTALCRALDIPARLIVSLQSVPWQASIGKPKPTYVRKKKGKANDKGKGKASAEDGDSEEDDNMEEVTIIPPSLDKGKGKAPLRVDDQSSTPVASSSKSEKAKGKEKAKPPVIKLRKSRPSTAPSTSASGTSTPLSTGANNDTVMYDPRVTPPVFWTEVFSRADGRWLPVDPIRGFVNRRKVFDPTPSTTVAQLQAPGSMRYPHPHAPKKVNLIVPRRAPQDNRMVYVIALEEDGYGRDVTRRYAKEFSAKIAKVQGGNIGTGAGGKGRTIWWERVVQSITRPFRLNRDDVEDEELEIAQMMEGMPTTMAGFKDHPLYVLTRHLKQNETINPPPPATPEIGKFRGEPVYPRSSVVSLKTSENWMRSEGRVVKEGSQPMKLVKIRAATVNKMRELEVLKDGTRDPGRNDKEQEGGDTGEKSTSATGEVMQGLYARSQTELYIPNPVVGGIVPKNNFGNIDLYVPSMLPNGAVHLPYKGIAKVARKLGTNHAEAVVGFEFRKRRAIPIIEGVVVAQENESLLLDAYWAAEQHAEEKARLKREDRVLKQWKRLIHGLRVRQRVHEEYGKPKVKKQESRPPREMDLAEKMTNDVQVADTLDASAGGGFLVEADDVVQAFHLPKPNLYDAEDTLRKAPLSMNTALDLSEEEINAEDGQQRPRFDVTYELELMDIDEIGYMDSDLSSASFPEPIPTATSTASRHVPKTMQEIAEAEERKRLEAVKEDEVEEIADVAIGKSRAPSATPPNGVAGGRRSIPKRNVRSSAAKSKKGSKRGTPVGTKQPLAASERTLRKRKRKDESSEDEEETNEETSSDDGDDEPNPSPAIKRARKGKQTAALNNALSSATPARTLRPRAAKTKTSAQGEKGLDDLLDQLE